MSLYQNSVLNKYLKALDAEKLDASYIKFKNHFHNPIIQENIRKANEEQYQEGFLRDLFVNVLGYTLNPDADFNLTTELKNVKGSKKTDGAILKGNKTLAVIELKGTNTTDLSKVETQAFGYKNNQPDCNYVITSNFEKLRFYIDNAIDFEEFNLFELTNERFEILWLCLSAEYLLKDIPKKIKCESLTQEEIVTKKLYKDYASFRNEIFNSIQKENPEYDKLTLFKKTQKLLDRFLFIFFAEDRLLVPPNSISKIIEKWKDDIDFGDQKPLYSIFKQYFNVLNVGRPARGIREAIFAYNGGLFGEDEILDNIKINDDLLYKHTLNLSNYDFESEVSVNILGHIFEHSLTEIEEIQNELEGKPHDGGKTKRKKEGVFYTPKYITKYIVDNTVGKLCEVKKNELDINDANYQPAKQRSRKRLDSLQAYRDWLLQLTICDPACGSGAFLNQTLEFLIAEHAYIDELSAKYNKDAMVLSDVENSILENNIYGVDINEEAIEIAKLGLWLHTAQKGRKLTALSNNIKCGNSLIDDPTVAGVKAFNWQKEFPEVFVKSGFDVIIGNPPYVRQELFKGIKPYLKENYKCYNSIADLYTYFIEKGINLMNDEGLFSFILPNKFLKATYGKNIRKVIKEGANLELLLDFDDYPVFTDATTYPIIYVLNKKKEYKPKIFLYSEINKRDITLDPIATLQKKQYNVLYESLKEEMWNFINIDKSNLLKKIDSNSKPLRELVNNKIFAGIASGKNDVFITSDFSPFINDSKANERLKLILGGSEISRYKINPINNKILFLPWDYDLNYSESIKEYLLKNKKGLEQRPEVKLGRFNWWCLSRYGSNNSHLLNEPKIIAPFINNKCNFYLDEVGEIYLQKNSMFISSGSKPLLAYLNSKISFFYLSNVCTTLQGGYYDFRRDKIQLLPVPNNLNSKENLFTKKVDLISGMNKKLNSNNDKFQNYLKQKFHLEKLSKKLQNWNELEFGDFIKELNKAIKSNNKLRIKDGLQEVPILTKKDEFEWLDLFEENKQKAQDLQTQINQTDKQIDAMVYELYGLTEEEINIVENS